MTSREALDYIFYNVNFQEPCCEEDEIKRQKAIKVINDMAEQFEKYEKALEIIAEMIRPRIVIKYGNYYWKEWIRSTEIIHALTPEDGQLLMELFGGTNYDRK